MLISGDFSNKHRFCAAYPCQIIREGNLCDGTYDCFDREGNFFLYVNMQKIFQCLFRSDESGCYEYFLGNIGMLGDFSQKRQVLIVVNHQLPTHF